MKLRNIEYEKKFRAYLFSFDYKTHKEICKNINVEAKKHTARKIEETLKAIDKQLNEDKQPLTELQKDTIRSCLR